MITQNQNFTKTFNFGLLISMFLIFGCGLITLFSATKGLGAQGLYKSQIIWFGVGMIPCVVLYFIDL
jgi:cell division protein FtsW (lipid II flippase)